jgi:hypothetical protein
MFGKNLRAGATDPRRPQKEACLQAADLADEYIVLHTQEALDGAGRALRYAIDVAVGEWRLSLSVKIVLPRPRV